ncbi:hypothetical protein CBR_g3197 [Chara braunii]|uniref:Reverse transcriptase domain-containing protein n=1 Tax=Chara braunii TaxID=69332 RepID=A0A388KF75_CHABU|nr:hypothetical protein CBR_g3197 [Chara braunii]|eukprot:GBG68656.1 hypothetical protein CBR_g3197 [Chara braunii]
MAEVLRLKQDLDRLVCVPLDRNPGDTLVMCPVTYVEVMRSTFVCNEGYKIIRKGERQVLREWGMDFQHVDFRQLGRWKNDGRLGAAYALPKHKDTEKYRPICPAYQEPSILLCKKIAQAMNGMLFGLPASGHFNLRSVGEMKGRLHALNVKMRRVCSDVRILTGSYDVQDMFSKLPHSTIERAVEWSVWSHRSRGRSGVFVKRRGRGWKLSRCDSVEGYAFLSFDVIQQFVSFELELCFTVASGYIVQQLVGIPMGKSSSPPLACLMCSKAEWDFMITLGNQRRLIGGLRFVDDASVFVAYNARKPDSKVRAEAILAKFERCYDEALTLKKTDTSEGCWEFLGCKLNMQENFPYLGCCQKLKNERELRMGLELTFRTFQDFESWTSKKAKLAVIVSALHRIDQNSMETPDMIGALILLRMELRRRRYPDSYFDRAIKSFARDKSNLWKLLAELLTSAPE